MAILMLASVTVVLVLALLLVAVHTTRPRSLRFTASLMRLLTLTLEVDSPQRPARGGTSKHDRAPGE